MRYRTLEEEAKAKREIAARLLASAADLEIIAAFRATAAGAVIELMLERHVENWKNGGAWGAFDDEAKREQGRALRSRELLEYFSSAEEEAKRQRAEAEKLIALVETAADHGRIPRA